MAIDINITGGNLCSIHFYIPRVLHNIWHIGVKEIFCLMKEARTISLPQGLCPSPKISFHVWRFLTHFKFPTGFFNLNTHLNLCFLSRSKNKIAIMFLPSQWHTFTNNDDNNDDDDRGCLLSTYYMLNILLSPLYVLIYLFFTTTLWSRCYYQPHYTKEKTKAQEVLNNLLLIIIARKQ